MSEEEKQAIETVKQYKKCFVFETVHEETGERLNDYSNAIDIVLNLLDKQQKEIEDLKERNNYLTEAIDEWVNGERINPVKHISKDKIREKIKKYEKLDKEEYAKQGNFEIEISLLKELLEE